MSVNKEEKIKEFKMQLVDETKREKDIQEYLEDNTEFIPLPILNGHQLHLNVVISKLQIGQEYVCDFAYLTKCSDYWDLVLMELEDPKKTIFKKDNQNIRFTHQFNDAYGQIESWKSYLEKDNNASLIKKRLRHLMGEGMYNIPFNIKYVLIYGRNSEKERQEKRIDMFNQKNTEKIKVKTYDSLISEYSSKNSELYKVILSPWKEDGYKIKKIPDGDIEINLFRWLTKENLSFSQEIKKQLTSRGYQIDKWEQGEKLTEGFGKTDKLTEYFSLDDCFKRKFIEMELKEEGKL